MAAERIPDYETTRLTPEEYLAFDRASETKHEYIDGFIIAMSGEFYGQMKGGPCQSLTQDMRTRVLEGHLYAYPDIVVCGEPQLADDEFDVLLNPTLIVEVLSESTEAWDRGRKFERYRRRPTLQSYVLVAQDRVSLEHFARQGEQGILTAYTDLSAVVELPAIGCTLALSDVYAGTPVATQPPAAEQPPTEPPTR